MELKHDLITKGYLPENLPPSFTTASISDYFRDNSLQDYYSTNRSPRQFQLTTYNSSKRGISRRMFSVIHPATAHDLAQFVSNNWVQLSAHYKSEGDFSLSVPQYDISAERALVISSQRMLEQEKFSRLSPYRFIVTTDISRFYHSIYTHSIPWAYHGKSNAKSDRHTNSNEIFFNQADAIIRNGQDGQSIGIPVGPDVSRVFAELIGTAIDAVYRERIGALNHTVIRYVDDIWIGVQSHADAEKALSCYQGAIREFELDINESKTGIFSENFRFLDTWPKELTSQLERISKIRDRSSAEKLRATLETSFSMAVKHSDDGILKYTLACVDRFRLSNKYWEVVEPFLMRVSIHFGHTIDFVVRILVLKHLRFGDLNVECWREILVNILNYHGRLGHDSEVCWLIYLQQILEINFENSAARTIADSIVNNCGAMALVAFLNSENSNLKTRANFRKLNRRIRSASIDNGRFWPVMLEWKSRQWRGHDSLEINDEIIQSLSENETLIYELGKLPRVFDDVTEKEFKNVETAIEPWEKFYGEDEIDSEDEIENE